MAIFPKAIYRLNAIPIKIPTQLFTDLHRWIFNFIWKKKNPRIAKTILNNKRTSGGISIPDIKLYYRAIVIKTAWHWYRNRQVNQWNWMEDPSMNTWFLTKKAKPYNEKSESIFNKWYWFDGLHVQECRLIHIYCPTQNSGQSGSRTST